MRNSILVSCMIAVLLFTVGCSNLGTVGPSQVSPELPAKSSMEIPSIGGDELGKQTAGNGKLAYLVAVTAVSYWTLTVNVALIPPRALFYLAHEYGTPEELPDNSGWKYELKDGDFAAVLVAKVEGDSARWSMTVTGDNLKDFTWFTGTSTITGSSGYWTFYDSSDASPAIRISYTRSEEATVEVVKQGDPEFGSYLKWESEGIDKTLTGKDAKKDETVVISWNESTEAGSIENLTTSEKYCWDTKENGHEDVVCASAD